MEPRAKHETLTVLNQPEPPVGLPLWEGDAPLRAEIARLAPAHAAHLASFAASIGSVEALEQGRAANRFPPELRTFDRTGRRIDEVEFHPAYHALMHLGLEAGYSALPWTATESGGHTAHAAMVYLLTQVEPGVCCPMTMTYAAVPALAATPALAERWRPGALAARYDPSSRPASEKSGLTIGMAMTEKQGGSDLRANTTRAEPDGDGYRLFGHKWFCSAPMSDAFLTLAQTPEGLTCFVTPRWQPDGTRNPIHLMRLKDKLGNRANASAEIEYHGAWAERLGELGRGVPTIIEMVHHTRLDTAMAPAGLMRRALVEAAWWTRNRAAFGKPLIDQPLMQAVLADLTLDWLGALAIGLRVVQAFDNGADPTERAFARIAVALAKYWSNKRCSAVVIEAMECLGGSGYVEESPLPWLYREAPLNAIWEGSGNIVCLDVMRTLDRAPQAMAALKAELDLAKGTNRDFDAACAVTLDRYASGVSEGEARHFVEVLALLLQSSLLLRHGNPLAAEAFIRTRLSGDWGRTFGTLPQGVDAQRIAAMIEGDT
ncbi:acyl-CoA dehydrogenase family protein [Devosia nitrariae]|uniref:Acyl-CoA dehydrogenase n=1 Tax=Devosia nitrariae TaxID=2071872 RepID=A0ABQ5W1B8_9HYPH|nr:acyl-CoA dehydrogenase family protein [Devosia nitrariae]GLQ53867.1 acyl-CoA dehydrogenase [Devosia nitrariae]